MPTRPVNFLDLSNLKGLHLTGPGTGLSPGHLRRARNLHESCLDELKPAPGNQVTHSFPNITTIARFDNRRWFVAGGQLYRDGEEITPMGTDAKLIMKRIPPGNTQPDHLFFVGSGPPRKIAPDLTITNWGINRPGSTFEVELDTQTTKTIENFEDATIWTVTPGTVTATDSATINQQGTNALKVNVPADTLAILTKPITLLDLSMFTEEGDSSHEDMICLWVRIDGSSHAFDYFTLRFDVGAGNFERDYYQFKFLPSNITVNNRILTGIGAHQGTLDNEDDFINDQGGGDDDDNTSDTDDDAPADDGSQAGDADGTGDMVMPSPANSTRFFGNDTIATASATWTLLRIAKSRFLRAGGSSNNWHNVVAIQLMIRTNNAGIIACYFDQLIMTGGAGMQGDYQSLITFDNKDTGARSNSNRVPIKTLQNDRQRLLYSNLPVSTDPQVNARTLWRTMGNGARFFKEHQINNNSDLTYESRVADFIGMWTNEHAQILSLPELPTDNIQPNLTHVDFIYDQAVVMWLDGAASKRGRIYFSPPGRPEAQRGFIQVCQDDTPLLRLIVWNRARYVIGESGWWRIDGSEPYTAFHFEGIPGVTPDQSRTIIPTPYGIVWHAQDGLSKFNGSSRDLLHFDRIGPLFRGEPGGQLTPFNGLCATFARDQYFISDGVQTLSINLLTGFIRDLGQGFTAFHYEEDTKLLLGGSPQGLLIIEPPGTPPSSPCSWETHALLADPGTQPIIQRLYIDAATGNLPITPTLILDGIERPLPAFTLATRGEIEYPLGLPYRTLAIRLDFLPTASSKIFSIKGDIYATT